MKHINQDNLTKQNERILYLIAELNSTLDLYYENVSEFESLTTESKIDYISHFKFHKFE